MTIIASLGEKLKSIYGRWTILIDTAWKFLVTFVVFGWIGSLIGKNEFLMQPFVLVILALICSLLSSGMITLFACVLITAHAFSIDLTAGALTFVILFVVYTLFLRFIADCALASSLIPVTFFFGFPIIVPIILGLKKRISAVFAAAAGVLLYELVDALRECRIIFEGYEAADYAGKAFRLLELTFTPSCIIGMLASAIVVAVVCIIRSSGFSHCFEAAILMGGIAYPVCLLLAGNLAGITLAAPEYDTVSIVMGTILSVLLALLFQILFLPLRFRAGERLCFEDDDYYYFVRAVPKVTSGDGSDS